MGAEGCAIILLIIVLAALGAILLFNVDTTDIAIPAGDCIAWANSHKPSDPSLSLSTDKEGNVRAISSEDATVLVTVNGKEVGRSGGMVSGNFPLKEGTNQIYAKAEISIRAKDARFAGCRAWASSEETREVLVDTTKPELISYQMTPEDKEGKTIQVTGSVRDTGSGPDRVIVEGKTASVKPDGTFSLAIPTCSVEEDTIQIKLYDREGLSSLSEVPVRLPPSRWELRDSETNELMRIMPGDFKPFDPKMVGWGRYLWGWTNNPLSLDVHRWTQYIGGSPQTPIAEIGSWPLIRLCILGTAMLLVAGTAFFFTFIAPAIAAGKIAEPIQERIVALLEASLKEGQKTEGEEHKLLRNPSMTLQLPSGDATEADVLRAGIELFYERHPDAANLFGDLSERERDEIMRRAEERVLGREQ